MTAADRPTSRDLRPRDVVVWTGQPRPHDFVKVIDRRKDDDSGWWMTDGSGVADYVWDDGAAWTTVAALLASVEKRDRALDAVLALPLPDEVDDWTAGYAKAVAEARDAITDALGGDAA